jgi:membrane protein required for colicin V production
MSLFDLVIVALLVLFSGIGALRGAVRELLSLGVWLVAILCGWLFADAVGTWFEQVSDADLRQLIAFLTIVMIALALLSLVVFVLRLLLPRPAPNLTSRIGGGVIGALRGAAVVVVLVLLAGLTGLPKQESWRDSRLVGVFRPAAEQILEWLPAPVARQFRYG